MGIMGSFTLHQLLEATGGELLLSGPAVHFQGICTDTRNLQRGDIFFALHGEGSNGHKYLKIAREMGAAGAVVDEAVPGVRRRHNEIGEWNLIEVIDTLYALGQLAQAQRRRFKIPVIAITGSAGKTTTKEMTAAILSVRHTVVKTPGNFNNEIGMPLTLMQLDEHTQTAVVEFGMRGPGQIGYLAALALPTVGVITNIGASHLELLGTREKIAMAKAELLEVLPAHATVVLPGEDDFFTMLRERARGPVVTVGECPDFDLWASDITLGDTSCANFTLHFRGIELPIALAVPGRVQVNNALAAAAAALAAGSELEDIAIGLAGYTGIDGRMQTHTAKRGFTVIDDSYNANPAAVRAALSHLAEAPGKVKLAILGDMRELGPDAAELHRELGAYAMTRHIDHLFALGELGRAYVDGADSQNAQWFPDHNAAIAAALTILQPGDIALIKGSRAMKMEVIVQGLVEA